MRNIGTDGPVLAAGATGAVGPTGDVGVAAQLSYDAETGRLSEIYEDEIDEEDDDFDNIPF